MIVLFVIIYLIMHAVLGALMQKHKVITHPFDFAMYGFANGVIFTTIIGHMIY